MEWAALARIGGRSNNFIRSFKLNLDGSNSSSVLGLFYNLINNCF